MRCGGYLEHAILLCNYFKFIELNNQNNQTESFVLVGNSIYGNCAYVLRRLVKENKFELWDPLTGDPYFYDMKTFETKFLFITISHEFKQ